MKYLSAVLALSAVNFVYGSFLQFIPLTPKQVYETLRRVGREDAVPEGRFITQGLAAMTGFAAGVATGIGVPLVLNIDLANVTGILGSPNNNAGSNQMSVQEICFNSRSLNEIDDGEENENEEMEKSFAESRKRNRYKQRERRELRENHVDDATAEVSTTDPKISEMDNTPTATTTTADRDNEDSIRDLPTTQTRLTTEENDADESPIDTRKFITAPATTGTDTETTDDGTGTGTNTESTTQTGNEGSVNCVVIQKPGRR